MADKTYDEAVRKKERARLSGLIMDNAELIESVAAPGKVAQMVAFLISLEPGVAAGAIREIDEDDPTGQLAYLRECAIRGDLSAIRDSLGAPGRSHGNKAEGWRQVNDSRRNNFRRDRKVAGLRRGSVAIRNAHHK